MTDAAPNAYITCLLSLPRQTQNRFQGIMGVIGTGTNFPPENPAFFHRFISYALVAGCIVPSIGVFMNILNRTRILGKEHISNAEPPFILMSNHLTLLDDLFLGPVLFFPRVMKGYAYFPFHAPEERNFYKKVLIRFFMKHVKGIPVMRGRGVYQEGVNRLISAVRAGGRLHIYPEGTRSRTGEIGRANDGEGRIVYETGAPVVPMYHQGLEKVLPIGRGVPRIGHEIRICIGKPLTFQAELAEANGPATWKKISERVMVAIHEQKRIMDLKWGEKPVIVKPLPERKQRA